MPQRLAGAVQPHVKGVGCQPKVGGDAGAGFFVQIGAAQNLNVVRPQPRQRPMQALARAGTLIGIGELPL